MLFPTYEHFDQIVETPVHPSLSIYELCPNFVFYQQQSIKIYFNQLHIK